MKLLKILFFILMFLLSMSCYAAYTEQYNALVIGIIDGDTVKVLKSDKSQVKIRLENIDAPEKGQAYSNQSKQFLSKLIYKKNVYISVSAIDPYGRYIATIYLDDINVNKEMVKAGYAWAYRYFLNDNEYITLENQAKSSKLGLWKDNKPIEPYLFRKNNIKSNQYY